MSDPSSSSLERALIDLDDDRVGPDDFLEIFLATEIFVPTPPPDEPYERAHVTKEAESFRLITLDVDGQEAVAVFDDFKRFEEWSSDGGSPVGYMGIPAGNFVDMIDPNLAVALFAGAEGFRLFDPETLAHIRGWTPTPPDGPNDLAPGTAVQMHDIEIPPDGLIEAMVPALHSLGGDVREARLVEFAEMDRPGTERLMMVLTLEADSKRSLESIVDILSQNVKPALGDIGYLDFMNLTESEFRTGVEDSFPPFFVRDGPEKR